MLCKLCRKHGKGFVRSFQRQKYLFMCPGYLLSFVYVILPPGPARGKIKSSFTFCFGPLQNILTNLITDLLQLQCPPLSANSWVCQFRPSALWWVWRWSLHWRWLCRQSAWLWKFVDIKGMPILGSGLGPSLSGKYWIGRKLLINEWMWSIDIDIVDCGN